MAGRKMFESRPPLWIYPFRAAFTAALVCVGWVFFRAANFTDSRYVIGQLFSFGPSTHGILIPPWLLWITAITLLVAIIKEKWDLWHAPFWVYTAAMVVLLLAIELLGVTDKQIPFIYFQF